jgi:hypothetical protein
VDHDLKVSSVLSAVHQKHVYKANSPFAMAVLQCPPSHLSQCSPQQTRSSVGVLKQVRVEKRRTKPTFPASRQSVTGNHSPDKAQMHHA